MFDRLKKVIHIIQMFIFVPKEQEYIVRNQK